jgi:hypothetical protein
MEDYCRLLLDDFLKTSFSTVKVLVEGAAASKGQNTNRKVTLFRYVDCKKVSVPFSDERFYMRGSVEYTNPQLTVLSRVYVSQRKATWLCLQSCSKSLRKATSYPSF